MLFPFLVSFIVPIAVSVNLLGSRQRIGRSALYQHQMLPTFLFHTVTNLIHEREGKIRHGISFSLSVCPVEGVMSECVGEGLGDPAALSVLSSMPLATSLLSRSLCDQSGGCLLEYPRGFRDSLSLAPPTFLNHAYYHTNYIIYCIYIYMYIFLYFCRVPCNNLVYTRGKYNARICRDNSSNPLVP